MKQKQLVIVPLALIGLLILSGCNANQKASMDNAQSLSIRVTSGGYSPGVLEAKKGMPVTLNFQASSSLGCAENLEIPEFGIRQRLTPNQTTPIKIVPKREGDFVIRCSMNMFTATLKVKS